MKKTLISFAIAATALLVPASMMAQTNTDNTKTEQTRGDKKQTRGDKKQTRGEGRKMYNPFEGLNLTEAQQSQLQALGCPSGKPAKDQKSCTDGQNCKSADKKAQNGQKPDKEERAKKALEARKEYLAKVKAILTPQQYIQFLENSFTNRPAKMDGRKGGHKDNKGHKGNKGQRGNQGPKGQKGQKPANSTNNAAGNSAS